MPTTRRSRVNVTIALTVGLFALSTSPLTAGDGATPSDPAAARDFSLIVLPDTQSYRGEFGIFTVQTSWI